MTLCLFNVIPTKSYTCITRCSHSSFLNVNALHFAARSVKQKLVLPPGEYHRMENLNKLPVKFLQTIFLKAVTLHQGSRKTQQQNMASVCSKWKNIVTVMHFTYRLARLISSKNNVTVIDWFEPRLALVCSDAQNVQ